MDHRARFDGWNFDERWEETELKWLGEGYEVIEKPTVAKKGQRPIVAYCGGPGGKIAVQFCEANKKIVGEELTQLSFKVFAIIIFYFFFLLSFPFSFFNYH